MSRSHRSTRIRIAEQHADHFKRRLRLCTDLHLVAPSSSAYGVICIHQYPCECDMQSASICVKYWVSIRTHILWHTERRAAGQEGAEEGCAAWRREQRPRRVGIPLPRRDVQRRTAAHFRRVHARTARA